MQHGVRAAGPSPTEPGQTFYDTFNSQFNVALPYCRCPSCATASVLCFLWSHLLIPSDPPHLLGAWIMGAVKHSRSRRMQGPYWGPYSAMTRFIKADERAGKCTVQDGKSFADWHYKCRTYMHTFKATSYSARSIDLWQRAIRRNEQDITQSSVLLMVLCA